MNNIRTRDGTPPKTASRLLKKRPTLLMQNQSAGKGQAIYHGFIKPREAHHDADLYRPIKKRREDSKARGETSASCSTAIEEEPLLRVSRERSV